MQSNTTRSLSVCIAFFAFGNSTPAGVLEFTSFTEWEAAVGGYNTINFTEFPKFTFITDQYEDLGILFTDGDDNIHISNAYPPDMAGLDGNESITLELAPSQHWLGLTFPGVVTIELYSGANLLFAGTFEDIGGPGAFVGLLSDLPFDEVIVFDPLGPPGNVNIGDLYFGPPIPAPGAIGLLACGAFASIRRRRR